jgi:formylglycine-generating enzyme required for sulfatase activity
MTGCPTDGGGGGNYTFTTPEQYRSMASIGAITSLAGAGSNGVFIEGRTVSLSAYKIAKYETTYELWYEVKTWATSNGYTFTNAGCEGKNGTDGAAPTSAAKTEPVTTISWRDAVVWCNAYSEMSGKTPAYYSDTGCTTVIKTLSGDTVYVKSGANGYRLPTEAEWEAAARGGNPSDTTNWAYTYAGSGTIGNVAVYGSNYPSTYTAPVGSKAANSAGLYDMSGNVWEWCWDWNGSISTGSVSNPTGAGLATYRVGRGGSWNSLADFCTVSYRYSGIGDPPYRDNNAPPYGHVFSDLGFRVVCAP